MDYTERVDGYQIRDVCYIGLPPKDTPQRYDIVKWVKANHPYEAYDLITGKRKKIEEYCYSIGTLEWNAKEPCFEFSSVGLRWLEENPPKKIIDMILDFVERKGKELESGND